MGESKNKEKAVVRYTSSILLGEIMAEFEVTDVHSFETIPSAGKLRVKFLGIHHQNSTPILHLWNGL